MAITAESDTRDRRRSRSDRIPGPDGGILARKSLRRRWRWFGRNGALVSAPIRCRAEQYYMLRVRFAAGIQDGGRVQLVRFQRAGSEFASRGVSLEPLRPVAGGEYVGWFESPAHTDHFVLEVGRAGGAAHQPMPASIRAHIVGDRRAASHPQANVPDWSTYRPVIAAKRILLPRSLADLANYLSGACVEALSEPRGVAELAARTRGQVWVLDPLWARRLRLNWPALRRLAADSWMIVDLATAFRAVVGAPRDASAILERAFAHDIPGARVEFADVATRGFALQDVFPYAAIDDGKFVVRMISAGKAWKRVADHEGIATLLSCDSAFGGAAEQVLSAAYSTGGGELLMSDAPWLLAGQWGVPVAPRLAAHVLRMHVGLPIGDDAQYAMPGDDPELLVRDIADFAGRYAPLRPVRWADHDGLLRLGLTMPAPAARGGRSVVIRTGRCDGLTAGQTPAELMLVFLRRLAQRVTTGDVPAGCAGASRVTWQFETACGRRYAPLYDAATLADAETPAVIELGDAAGRLGDVGLLGDGVFEYQARLYEHLWRELGDVHA